MAENKDKDLAVQENTAMVNTMGEVPLGFDEVESEDIIVPRVKVVQAVSPERKEKKAEEGDIINSLTFEKLNNKIFIPVFMFKSNIAWIDRDDGGGIECMARLGKVGVDKDGNTLACVACKRNEFDNSKQGKDSIPTCTKYINFFGFFEGTKQPIVLSFSKTNYNDGKTIISLAKSTMQNMFNYGYRLVAVERKKNNDSWFVIESVMEGITSDEDRKHALTLYMSFKDSMFKFDVNEVVDTSTVDEDSTEY